MQKWWHPASCGVPPQGSGGWELLPENLERLIGQRVDRVQDEPGAGLADLLFDHPELHECLGHAGVVIVCSLH